MSKREHELLERIKELERDLGWYREQLRKALSPQPPEVGSKVWTYGPKDEPTGPPWMPPWRRSGKPYNPPPRM